jgi:hypothetical protein
MCNIQNSIVKVAQAVNYQNIVNYKLVRPWRVNSLQLCKVLQYKVAAQAMEVPG